MNNYMKHMGPIMAADIRKAVADGEAPESLLSAAIWIETVIDSQYTRALNSLAAQQHAGMPNQRGNLGL